jgi:hypothetical protein
MIEIEDSFDVVEFSTDNNIRMLEQLNKTLELLQSEREITVSEEKSARKKAEESVLECIRMICTPIIAFKATPDPA